MAELLAADRRLKPTTAIWRIDPRTEPSAVRRLQVKWKIVGAGLLKQACARPDPEAKTRSK